MAARSITTRLMEKKSRTPTSESSQRHRSLAETEGPSQDDYNSLDEGEVRIDDSAEETTSPRGHELEREDRDHRDHRDHDVRLAEPLVSMYDHSGSQRRRHEREREEQRRLGTRQRIYANREGEESSQFQSMPGPWVDPSEEQDDRDQQLTPAEMRDLIRHLRMTNDQLKDQTLHDKTETRQTGASDSETNYESAVEHPKSTKKRSKKRIHFLETTTKRDEQRHGGGDAGSAKPKGRFQRQIEFESEDASTDDEPETLPDPVQPNQPRFRRGASVPFRTFDGKRWAAFKRQFDSACIANKIPDEDRGARLECALVGEATDVLGEDAQTYEQLVETLHARYGETKAKKEVLLELMTMKREATETVLVFADRMKRVARSGGLKPDQNVESLYMAFINGMAEYSDTLTAVCKKCKVKSLDEAARVACKYEMLHGRTPSGKEVVKSSWGLVAAVNSHDAGGKVDVRKTETGPKSGLDGALFDRVVKLERETEKISTLTKSFSEDVKATRRETKAVNDVLVAFKSRYDENEFQRAEALKRKYGRDAKKNTDFKQNSTYKTDQQTTQQKA